MGSSWTGRQTAFEKRVVIDLPAKQAFLTSEQVHVRLEIFFSQEDVYCTKNWSLVGRDGVSPSASPFIFPPLSLFSFFQPRRGRGLDKNSCTRHRQQAERKGHPASTQGPLYRVFQKEMFPKTKKIACGGAAGMPPRNQLFFEYRPHHSPNNQTVIYN
jgi:hypothetical protein